MGEMTPLSAAQAAQFTPARYDVEVLTPVTPDAARYLAASRSMAEGTGAVKRGAAQLLNAAALLGFQSRELSYAAASFELIAGAMEAYSALKAIREALAVARVAEGIAALAKYTVAAPIVAAAAVGAAVVMHEQISDAVRQVDIEGEFSTPAGIRALGARVSAAGWS